MDKKTANKLRQEYPNHVPLKVAAAFFGVSCLLYTSPSPRD